MKIATFNVNGISALLSALLRWLAESKPGGAVPRREVRNSTELSHGDSAVKPGNSSELRNDGFVNSTQRAQ